jgi:anthranilate phosphoribosyltransferase
MALISARARIIANSMDALLHALQLVAQQRVTLSEEEARLALLSLLDETVALSHERDLQIAALLGALAARGETVEELTGFVRGMRERATGLPLSEEERGRVVDTCGTGGDGSGTFNISTGAALVAAAAGAWVAKHGNRSVTSRCGSADVLESLSIPVTLGPEQAAGCLRATGFVFLYAPIWHPAMARVRDARRILGFRTIFNLAGPLTNPAGARAQVMGVYNRDRVPLVAETMTRLGVHHAFVVHGCDGLDEITTTGETDIATVNAGIEAGGHSIRHFHPREVGLPLAKLDDLQGGDAKDNAIILEAIFSGNDTGPRRDIVLLNAAAALVAAGLAENLNEGLELGRKAIQSGAVMEVLEKLRIFPGSKE